MNGRASQSRLIQLSILNHNHTATMNWEMLPDDVWSLIGSKLDAAGDRVRFRAVCKSWMSLLPFPPPIWLMIPQSHHHHHQEDEEEGSSPCRGFAVAGEEHIYHFDLPQFHKDKRCVGSTGTCLITVDLDGNITVLDILSRLEINFPPVSTFKDKMPQDSTTQLVRDSFISKIVLSSTDIISNHCIAMAIHTRRNKLAIARPGDASWTLLESDDADTEYLEDIIFLNGNFYVVSFYGLVSVIQVGDSLDSCQVSYFTREEMERRPENCPPKKHYLVEWMGEFLLVVRHIEYPPEEEDDEEDETAKWKVLTQPADYNTESFQLYKLDMQNKHLFQNNWVELNSFSLGEHSLFLGLNTSVSLRVSDYNGSLNKNSIYFTDDFSYGAYMGYLNRSKRRGLDMGVYNLETKTIQPCYKDAVFLSRASPIWAIPTLPAAIGHKKANSTQ